MGLYLEKIRSDFGGASQSVSPYPCALLPMQASPTQANLTETGYLSIYLSDGTVSKQLSVREGAYLKNYRSAKKCFIRNCWDSSTVWSRFIVCRSLCYEREYPMRGMTANDFRDLDHDCSSFDGSLHSNNGKSR